jgi:hypothetical protein
MLSRSCAVVAIGTLAAACATGVQQQQMHSAADARVSDSISGVELSRTGTQDLTSALRALRPLFLTGRGSPPMLIVDGGPPTDLSGLRSIRVDEVSSVKYVRSAFDVGFPTNSNGHQIGGGVLIVRTCRGP